VLPISSAQRSVWLLDQLATRGGGYNRACRIAIDGPVEAAMLTQALAVVVARHDALRATFHTIDGQPIQVIGTGKIPIRYEDLRDLPDPVTAAGERATATAREPFDLARGPLLRARLLHLDADRFELLLITHQIIADRRSCTVLVTELAAAYASLAVGAPMDSGVVPSRVENWSAADEAYWRDALAGAPQAVALPTDRARGSEDAGPAAAVDFVIDAPTADGLRGMGDTAAVLALFATVLSRYTGSDDLMIGLAPGGTYNAVGLFTNTLPLRVRTDGDPTFAALTDRVHDVVASGLAHQDMPYDRIVERVAPQRTATRAPLVQVLLAVEAPPATIAAGPVTFRPTILDNGTAEVDLALGVIDSGGPIAGRLTYDTDLLDPGTVAIFADSLVAAARAVAADPQVRVADIEMMTPEIRSRALDGWGTGPALGVAEDLVAMLTGALQGNEPAIVAGATALSRDEVAEWSGQIADALAAVEVGPESSVGVCLSRGAALVPAMLGVWTAGAAYVPLDPAYPAERLRMMIADSDIQVVLTQQNLAGLVRGMVGTGVTVVRVDAPDLRAATPVGPVTVPPEALAYTIFTSGSTGRPKGVAVPRGAVAALLGAFEAGIGLTGADTMVAVTTLSFDIAVLELLLPLLVGGRVVIADASTAGDGAMLRQLLVSAGATALQATPATWRMLATVGGVPSTVRLRLCGGEAVPPDIVDLLTADRAEAWNVYGPTETTVWSAAGRIWPSPAPVEVGPPIAGTRLLVLDGALRLVPPGVVGEVYIGGAGVTRGYHGRAALTAERFVPDPFAAEPGARMYRTGDLARWRHTGRLEMLGRIDHQVKLRGFRIETGEIEAILGQHDSVSHAVVTAHVPPGAAGAAGLVAYVVPAGEIDIAVLRRHLRAYVPDYMVPAAFITLAELPLTPNGKVDRARLPQPEFGAEDAAGYVPPATPTQRRLVEMWSELLPDAKRIGIHDSFFALGGHSLTAIQFTTRFQTEYGVKLTLRRFFTHPTIGALADQLAGSTVQ
jgi:amino acid adenylation domain-containing protein